MAINAFTYPDLTNRTTYPNPSNTATNIGNQLTNALISITNQLNSEVTNKLASVADGSSGADMIGATAIANLGASNTVQAILEAIYTMAVNIQLGDIVNGSLTDEKLSTNAGQINSRVVNNAANINSIQLDVVNNWTATNTSTNLLTIYAAHKTRRYMNIMYEG